MVHRCLLLVHSYLTTIQLPDFLFAIQVTIQLTDHLAIGHNSPFESQMCATTECLLYSDHHSNNRQFDHQLLFSQTWWMTASTANLSSSTSAFLAKTWTFFSRSWASRCLWSSSFRAASLLSSSSSSRSAWRRSHSLYLASSLIWNKKITFSKNLITSQSLS